MKTTSRFELARVRVSEGSSYRESTVDLYIMVTLGNWARLEVGRGMTRTGTGTGTG